MDLKKLTIAICVSWLLIISIWVIKSEIIFSIGREILLETVPVDPRDLVMGDYVILNYKVGQLPKYQSYIPNKEVYTILNINQDNVAQLDRISFSKPSNGIYLRGKMSKCNTIFPFWKNGYCIAYGIESYYVKEHEGKPLERNLAKGTLVKVVVDRDGNAKVKGFVEEN